MVAHSLSVIVVQADGAAAGAEQRPEAAAAALRTIGDTGREALGQMRRLLGVLREHGPASRWRRSRARTQLDALVEQVARAGVPARLSREGRPRPVAEDVDLTVYRLAQEALTNVLKHAGPVSQVDVVLRYGDDAVELVVRDDGHGARAAGDGAGQGLVGMRERVGLHDGTLEAGPSERRLRGARHPVGDEGADLPRRRPGARAGGLPHADRGAARHGGRRRGGERARRAGGAGRHARGRRADGRAHARARRRAGHRTPDRRRGRRAPKVIVLTTFDLDEYVFAAIRAGASGFLLKDARPEELLGAIRAVLSGDAVVAPSATRRLLEHVAGTLPAETGEDPRLALLTPREREVLLEVASGRSNAEIGADLFMAEATVKTHVGRLLAKLGQRDRVQLAVFAYETGLIRGAVDPPQVVRRSRPRADERAPASADPAGHDRSSQPPRTVAFAWTAFFILWHGYWALGGDFGFGDQESGFPDAGWLFTVVVAGLFAAGLAVPLAIARDVGPRRLLRGLLWIGAVVLAARGVAGLADDALRFSGAAETGLTGLSDEQVLGSADPSAYTIWSTIGIDSFFALGGGLFAWAAQRSAPARLPRLPWATVVVWIAILAPLPYSLSRLLWAAGVPIGISEQGLDDLGSPGWGSLVLVALAVLTEATALIVHHFVWRRERTLRGRPVRPRLVVASLLAPVVILTYANAITAAGVLGVFDAAESGLHGDDWGVPMTGILFWIWGLALTATTIVYHRRTREAAVPGRGPRSLAWAAYAACGWAIAYAVGVRGYQGLGGTVGLAGTFKDPGAMRHASLLAGAAIFVLGLGALSFVRPWGLLLPALAADRLRAGRLGLLDGARADGLRDQAAGPARGHRHGVLRLGAARRRRPGPLGPAVLRTVVPGPRAARHAGNPAPSSPNGRLRRGPPAVGGRNRGGDGRADRGGLHDGHFAGVVQTSKAPSGGSVPGT